MAEGPESSNNCFFIINFIYQPELTSQIGGILVRYNYSLDVGESVKTDDKLKEKEKEAPSCGCGAPKKVVKLSDEDKIKEEKEESTEENPESVEEEPLEEVPETKKEPEPEEKKEEKVDIKPISFEKAKLVSDYTEDKEKEPEKPAEEEAEEEIEETPMEEPQEEDEKDVNEFLEDSFSKEAKNYEKYNHKKTSVPVEEPAKRSIWPIILLIILIGGAASIYGYAIFKEPVGSVTAPDVVVPPVEPVIVLQNTTENITLPEKIMPEEPVEEPPAAAAPNKTIDQALEQFTLGLKD